LGIIFVSLGIAEIAEQTVTQELRDVSFIALDDFSADVLVCTHHVPVLFGIELGREAGRIDQITKHHRELPSFRVRRRCSRERFNVSGWLCLHNRLWCWLSRRRGCGGGFRSVPSPHEYSAIFIRGELLCLDDLRFEGFEILVIQTKPYLEGRI
jgi:hypothetical protein